MGLQVPYWPYQSPYTLNRDSFAHVVLGTWSSSAPPLSSAQILGPTPPRAPRWMQSWSQCRAHCLWGHLATGLLIPVCQQAWLGARANLEREGGGRRKKSSSHSQEMAGLQDINLLPSQLPGPQEFVYDYFIYYHYLLFYVLFHVIPTTTVFSFHGQLRLRNNRESPAHICQTQRPVLSITSGIFLVTDDNNNNKTSHVYLEAYICLGFPGGSDSKESVRNARDPDP